MGQATTLTESEIMQMLDRLVNEQLDQFDTEEAFRRWEETWDMDDF